MTRLLKSREALLVGVIVWAVIRSGRSGARRQEARSLKEGARRRRKGDEVMSQPVANERDWLERQRRRLARVRNSSRL